jgi:hypothetical protein
MAERKPRDKQSKPHYENRGSGSNPGDGEIMPNPSSSDPSNGTDKGSESGSTYAGKMKAGCVSRQDAAWAQLNPEDYVDAFNEGRFNARAIVKGALFPWNFGTDVNPISYSGKTYNVSRVGNISREPVIMVFDMWPSIGKVAYTDTYDILDPQIEIGKLLYQSISARKKSALPVDALSISAYLIALQTVCMFAAVLRRVLRLASIVRVSARNKAKRAKSMLSAMGFSEAEIDKMTMPEDYSDIGWINATTTYNNLIGQVNQLMAPPDLPIYKRMWYLVDHIFQEIDDDEKSTFYMFRPTWAYKINWIGDKNGTTLEPVPIEYESLQGLLAQFKTIINAFTGYTIGSDDANNVQAGLKYVFEDKLSLPTWTWETYTLENGNTERTAARATWDDILLDATEAHTMIHNMRIMSEVTPGMIQYNESKGGIDQQIRIPGGHQMAQLASVPVAWDFPSTAVTMGDLYEASTLCPFIDPATGAISCGTEVVNYARVYNLQPSGAVGQERAYATIQEIDSSGTLDATNDAIWPASFGHRPLRFFYEMRGVDENHYDIIVCGCDYDTTAMAPINNYDLDRMHAFTLKSYFGIRNDNTLEWVTPSSK